MQPFPLRDAPVGLLAVLVSRAARQLVAAQVEPFGLSTQQFWALVNIAEASCSSQTELATRMRIDEGTASRVVRSLIEAGWITAVRDGADRRRVRLALAPAGEAVVRRTLPVARRLRATIDSALTAEERDATRAGLSKVLAKLSTLAGEAASASQPPAVAARRSLRRAKEPLRRASARRRGGP
jgi:DNA-binding MarR family transcriptional regulator